MIKMMQIIPIEFGSPEYDEAVRLRYEVLRRPLGLFYTEAALAAEYADIHLGCYDVNVVLRGVLILTPQGSQLKMRQVAVDAACQRQGIGKQLVAYSEAYARVHGFKKIVLHARAHAIPFYDKLGYQIFGAPFEEVGIPHRAMEKNL